MKVEASYVNGRVVHRCPECGYEKTGEFPILRTMRNAFGRRETVYKCPSCHVRLTGVCFRGGL